MQDTDNRGNSINRILRMNAITAYGSVKKTSQNTIELSLSNKNTFNLQVIDAMLLKKEQANIILTISEDKEPKTNPQLRYYFGVVVPVCMAGFNDLGWQYDKTQTDTELRMRFFAIEVVNTKDGEIKRYVGSLSKASKEDLMALIDRCIQFAAQELGVFIPKPSTLVNIEQYIREFQQVKRA